MEIFSQFSDWLDIFLTSITDNFWLSMLFIFLVSIGECVFILGLFVPSTPVLLLTGSLMAVGRLPFWPIYLAAVVGAVIGDTMSYWLGRLLEHRIREIWPFRNYKPQIAQGELFFQHHGGKSVFIGRFIPGVKAIVPGVAGMLGMPWYRFFVINVISAFCWAAAHILPGLLLSNWLKSIGLSIEFVIVWGTIGLVALYLLFHFRKRILLFFAPFLGSYGKTMEARLRKGDATH
ncbi:MAG: DedA family protein [Devosia sp.]|nr:DedA family protein [Devosiaceae bacterium]